jgi:hypothetical protein
MEQTLHIRTARSKREVPLPVVWVDVPFKTVRISRNGSEKLYSDSLVLHRIKLALISQGYDVVKRRFWSDGKEEYIRDRQWKFAMYDNDAYRRTLYEDYNKEETVTLAIERWEKND